MKRLSGTSLTSDRRGVAVIEFALISPVLLIILFGIVAWGGYFWMAHSLQQIANDAARAAIAGLTSAERESIARAAVNEELPRIGELLRADHATVAVDTAATGLLSVTIRYDATSLPFSSLPFAPAPGPIIVRTAAVRLGGM